MFEINNEKWCIKFTNPFNNIFLMENGDYTIGTCDDPTKTIYLADTLKGKKSHIGVDNIIELSQTYQNCIFYTTYMGNGVREEIQSLRIKNFIPLKDYDEFEF